MTIRRFEEIPSPDDFSSLVESKNEPAVFRGCIKDWKAFLKWNPSNGGLDYLQERLSSSVVEAMLSKSAPVFYGDIRSHERVRVPFTTFISLCKQIPLSCTNIHCGSAAEEVCDKLKTGSDGTYLESMDVQKIYLAQVPIMNSEHQESSQLETLLEDIEKPSFIQTKAVESINFWMNSAESRSSTHYDPHHNLLCVVSGSKQVFLWPPSATHALYPMAVYGEASNHSAVDVKSPDFSFHPRAKHAMNLSQTVTLHAGDALFIPEGWLVDKEMNQMIRQISLDGRKEEKTVPGKSSDKTVSESPNESAEKIEEQQRSLLHKVEPLALHAIHQLVSLVHYTVNIADRSEEMISNSCEASVVNPEKNNGQTRTTTLSSSGDDAVAGIILNLEPLVLRVVLLRMAHDFPRTLETLVLHMLSPLAAEVLTRKFDEIDQQITRHEQSEFYRLFYSAFDDQIEVMNAILNAKESFASQAFKNVLDQYLGVRGERALMSP